MKAICASENFDFFMEFSFSHGGDHSWKIPVQNGPKSGWHVISATMLALKTRDPRGFRSARHFAAWIGPTPKDHLSGGKNRLGTITKAGGETLRSILVVGAPSVISQMRRGRKRYWPWLERLLEHKPPKLVAIARSIAVILR